MPLSFVKMEALGNDFVVVDRRQAGTPLPADEATRLCDRHFGVGADGVLSLLPSARAPLAMHVRNPDGSVPEMCGNGLRCVVRLATERGWLGPEGGPVETGRGVLACEARGELVRVDMGRPLLRPPQVPFDFEGESALEVPLTVGERTIPITAVSMGNPHAVWFVEEDQLLWDLARRLGPGIERHPRFPDRVNAGFARWSGPTSIDLVVWERGAGLTLACGTGACAAAVAACLTGRAPAGEPLSIRLPGGVLEVEVAPGPSRVWMTGPATKVFEGVAG